MSEKGQIARMGGKAQRNSGRGSHAKGDAILAPFLVDIKEYSKSFSVSVKNWAKLTLDAYKAGGHEPAFNLALEDNGAKVEVWVVGNEMFHEMRQAYLEKYEIQD